MPTAAVLTPGRRVASFFPPLCLLLASAGLPFASSDGVDYYSASDLQSRGRALAADAKAKAAPLATRALAQYPNNHTLFAFRNADGAPELHEHESDLYLVVEGEATLVSGGTLLDRAEKSAGEYTGSGIDGGHSQLLSRGDVVHIAPATPHQLKVGPGRTFSYFVQKVKER